MADRLSKSEFFSQHVEGKTDRELLEAMAWASYQGLQIGIENADRLSVIKRDIDRIEAQADDAMSKMGNPEELMKTFMGGLG